MEIKIHKDTWEVKLAGAGKKKMNPAKGEYLLGRTECLKGIIHIREGMPRPMARSTVIHELVHAFQFSYGYEIQGEEAMCDFFGAHGDEIICLADQVMEGVVGGADSGGN